MEQALGGGATANRGRFHRKKLTSGRFLGSFTASMPSIAGVELTEHDIFDNTAEPIASTSNPVIISPTFNNRHHQKQLHHGQKNFGILAALPASDTRSVFNHKASAASPTSPGISSSSTSSSSAVMIPAIPSPRRPPVINNKVKYFHHSAPVNVPVLSAAMAEERRRRRGLDYISEEDDDDDAEMLPPHEIVAAKHMPELSCSVLEGVGRKLRGRDLRQVRAAVLQRTGLID